VSYGFSGKFELIVKDILLKLYSLHFVRETLLQYSFQNLKGHRRMLSDKTRVHKFKKAIMKTVRKYDTVLDVGTGTGILAFFAANMGAKKIYAVDYSKIIHLAQEIATKNNFNNITFIRANLNRIKIPKVDCIISELIGGSVVDEGIIDKMRFARKFLKNDGKMIPKKIEIMFSPAESNEFDFFWQKRYGIDFSPFHRKLSEKTYPIQITNRTEFLSNDKLVYSLNFYSLPKIIFVEKTFKITKNGYLNCFCAYFKIYLTDTIQINSLDNNPEWKSFILPVKEALKVKKGDLVKLKVWTAKNNTEWKWDYELLS